jgi:hypothetical protein
MTPLAEDVVAYSLAVAPCYQAIRRLLVQFGGILILQTSAKNGAALDAAICGVSANILDELTESLATVRPPFRLRARHAQLQRCLEDLKYVAQYVRSVKTAVQADAAMITAIRNRLNHALQLLKTAEHQAAGLTVVDFTQSCACHPFHEICPQTQNIARA